MKWFHLLVFFFLLWFSMGYYFNMRIMSHAIPVRSPIMMKRLLQCIRHFPSNCGFSLYDCLSFLPNLCLSVAIWPFWKRINEGKTFMVAQLFFSTHFLSNQFMRHFYCCWASYVVFQILPCEHVLSGLVISGLILI